MGVHTRMRFMLMLHSACLRGCRRRRLAPVVHRGADGAAPRTVLGAEIRRRCVLVLQKKPRAVFAFDLAWSQLEVGHFALKAGQARALKLPRAGV